MKKVMVFGTIDPSGNSGTELVVCTSTALLNVFSQIQINKAVDEFKRLGGTRESLEENVPPELDPKAFRPLSAQEHNAFIKQLELSPTGT
ncbi:MAG: hypothetical protein UT48_C0013G0002 [Parcubacteria group bacterium GW2011_GWE2_39_37]|nr:MAG: hypothetical protein UT48_C0013G0002 [Parcubacteria group bacterium GW2011_GWE2_39_37]